jgi:hypothetical protein
MAVGAWLLLRGDAVRRAVGWTLVFAPLPFARLFTAALGGGDEKTALRMLLPESVGMGSVRMLALIVVATLAVPPLVVAWRSLRDGRRWLPFVGFLIGPMLFSFVWNHILMNRVLAAGVLSETVLLGTPTLILLHTLAAAAVAFLAISADRGSDRVG